MGLVNELANSLMALVSVEQLAFITQIMFVGGFDDTFVIAIVTAISIKIGNNNLMNSYSVNQISPLGSLAHADKCYEYYIFLGAFAHSEVEQPSFEPASWLARRRASNG